MESNTHGWLRAMAFLVNGGVDVGIPPKSVVYGSASISD
tara:strand:- start:9628 stop:9744 length:117 start_codon:yes stop_codon:yes gene_type:complete